MYSNQNYDNSDNASNHSGTNDYYSNQPYQQSLQPTPEKHSNSLVFTIIVILAILAVGGIAFGAFTFISSNSKIAELNETISEQESTIKNSTTLATTDTNGDHTSNYIYIGEWGIKIKIPEDLSWVGYTFTPSNNTSSIAVYGAKGQFDTRPDFLSSLESTAGYGFIIRAPAGYGSEGGLRVLSIDGYDYYYELLHQANTDDTTDAALEAESKELVKTMLTTAENYSSI